MWNRMINYMRLVESALRMLANRKLEKLFSEEINRLLPGVH